MFRDEGGPYVEILCDSCGKFAYRLIRSEYTKATHISGLSLDECHKCEAARRAKEKVEYNKVRAIEKKKDAELRKFLKKAGISRDRLRDILPDNFWPEYED